MIPIEYLLCALIYVVMGFLIAASTYNREGRIILAEIAMFAVVWPLFLLLAICSKIRHRLGLRRFTA